MGVPRVVTEALVSDAIRLPGGLVLHRLSIAHTLLLQKIESPFLGIDGDAPAKRSRSARAASAGGELDMLAVVYLLTRTDSEIDQLFFGFDRPAFDRAVWCFAKEQSPAMLVGLEANLTAIFAHATSTLIGGGDAPDPQKKTI